MRLTLTLHTERIKLKVDSLKRGELSGMQEVTELPTEKTHRKTAAEVFQMAKSETFLLMSKVPSIRSSSLQVELFRIVSS